MILHELNHLEMEGPLNAASPNAVSQKKMVKAIATALGVNAFVLPIPKFVMRLAMGERFGVLVDSFHLSADKIQNSGYHFEFSNLDPALEDLLGT